MKEKGYLSVQIFKLFLWKLKSTLEKVGQSSLLLKRGWLFLQLPAPRYRTEMGRSTARQWGTPTDTVLPGEHI